MKEKNSFWIFSAKSRGPNIVTRAYKNNYLRLVSFCWAAVLKVIEKKLLEALTASIINSFTRKANILCLTEVMGRKTLGKRRIILRSHITCLSTWRICQTLACFTRSDCTVQREVSRKISEGVGSGSESEGTPVVLFSKSWIQQGIPDSGITHDWFILTALVNTRRSITLIGNEIVFEITHQFDLKAQ